MKNAILAVGLFCLASVSLAQGVPPPEPPPAPGTNFAAHKQRVLAHLAKVTACVQASTNHDQLEACRRHHH